MDTTDWTVLAVFVYCLTAAVVAFHAFVLRRASIFEPIGQYLVFVSLFTLPLPVRACITLEIEGDVTPHLPALVPYLPVSVLLTAASLPLFSIAYYGSWARRVARVLPVPTPPRRDRSGWAFLGLTAFSLYLIYELTQEAGGLLAFLLLGYGSTEETFGRGYLAIGFPWLFVGSLFLFMRYLRRHTFADALLFGVALLGVLSVQFVTGNRAMLVYILLVTLILVHYCVRRLRWYFLVPFGLVAFLGLNLLGAVRGSNYEDLGAFVEHSASSAERITPDNSEGFFYTLTTGEFVVPFETLPQMIDTIGVSENPLFGLSYWRAPLYLVPSVLFPDRPSSVAKWYMDEFYGGGYGLNEGRQFFFLAEAYLNFGPAGILMLALLWGCAWGVLHQWLLRSNLEASAVLIYALLVGYMFRGIAGDFSSLIAGATQQSLVAALLGLAIAGARWRSRLSRGREVIA